MTRDISTEINTAIQSSDLSWCTLLDLEFDSATVYMWSGVGDLSYGGNTYKGVGALGNLSGAVENLRSTDNRIKATLSGIDISGIPSFIDEVTADDPTGRPYTLRIAVMDRDTGDIDGDPYILSSGFMDSPTAEDGANNVIGLDLVSEAARLSRVQMYRLTSDHQDKIFPGDEGLDFVGDLDDEVRWGSSESTNVGVGAGGLSPMFSPFGKFGRSKNLA